MTDSIQLFLLAQWRAGVLFLGHTAKEAFFVTCNETILTQDDLLNGRLICEIGIATVRPAEFVVFRIFSFHQQVRLMVLAAAVCLGPDRPFYLNPTRVLNN